MTFLVPFLLCLFFCAAAALFIMWVAEDMDDEPEWEEPPLWAYPSHVRKVQDPFDQDIA